VDRTHHRFVVNLETLGLVVLLAQQDQPVEGIDLLPVHVRDAARAVGDVLQFGEDDDTSVGVYLLRGAGSAHTGGTSADDHDGVRHRFVPSLEPSSSSMSLFAEPGERICRRGVYHPTSLLTIRHSRRVAGVASNTVTRRRRWAVAAARF